MTRLVLGIPSKGRLMEATEALLGKAGFAFERSGSDRLYRGRLGGVENIDIAFLSASEIASALKEGKIDLGVTGEDLLRETLKGDDDGIDVVAWLGFGFANVVVAVPESWLDVARMSDLDEVSEGFYHRHGRRLRVATKYLNLTRRFFASKGVTGYRIVESLGATEGAPAAGTAEAIVDITTTGSTLAANHLKILDDGVILKSQAVLAAQSRLEDDQRVAALRAGLKRVVAAA